MDKKAYLYVCDTMADWETGFVTAELNSGRFFNSLDDSMPVITVSNSLDCITTMGGIKIKPDLVVSDLILKENDILILPGGDTWLESFHSSILERADFCLKNNILLAAICGATFALADKGLLEGRYHTSNDLGYLKSVCKNYSAEDFYINAPAVEDKNLITASGVAALDFAYQIIKKLNVFNQNTLESWYNLNKTKEGRYFYSLMESVSNRK